MDVQKIDNFQPADDWHVYQIDWTPNYIAWWLDGKEVRRETGTVSVKDIRKAKSLFMNFWTPTFAGWGDDFNDATMPWYTRYDWVEYYDYDAPNDNFVRRWRDEFNTLNLDRWRPSRGWSFKNNSSLFVEPNTYVENGNLVLKMEKSGDKEEPIDDDKEEPIDDDKEEPIYDDTLYYFSYKCSDKQDQSLCADCSVGQACHRSYPFGDELKMKSPDEACRCLPRQRAPHGYHFATKTRSDKVDRGTCYGCPDCAYSYPKDDPARYKSAEKMLRCRADSEKTFVYGWDLNHCGNKYDGDCGADCNFCLWSYESGDPNKYGSSDAKCRCPPT